LASYNWQIKICNFYTTFLSVSPVTRTWKKYFKRGLQQGLVEQVKKTCKKELLKQTHPSAVTISRDWDDKKIQQLLKDRNVFNL